MYSGPKIKQEGLVFGYDTGQNPSSDFNHKDKKRRHFRGEPTTNLWDSIDNTQSLRGSRTQHYWNGKRWLVNSTYADPGVRGPKNVYLGKVFKFTSGALSSSWSGNSYGYMLRDIATTSGQTYTLTCWVYASTDCDVTAIPAVIEGESGGESTVSGYDAQYNLSNKGTWQRIAKKAIADTNVRFIPVYPRKNGVTNGSFNGFFMWAAPQVVLGDRPKPYVQTGSSRSSTNSLIDLKKSKTLDLANVSFDTDGLPTFDGTDDQLIVEGVGIGNYSEAFSYECVFKAEGTWANSYISNIVGNAGSYAGFYGLGKSGTNTIQFVIRDANYSAISGTVSNVATFHHLVGVWDQSNSQMRLYIDGELASSASSITKTGAPDTTNLYIGGRRAFGGDNGSYYDGVIPVVKYYNTALTTAEVKQNFLAYRRRFNL